MYEIKQFFWVPPKMSYPTYREMIIIRNKIYDK